MMLGKISTTILLAIIAYQSVQYYKQWAMEKTIEQYRNSKQARKHDSNPSGSQMKPEVIKVSENVYVAVGYALANSILLIGDDGIVIVDTTESFDAARRINDDFRKITNKTLKGVIYTHNHVDHILGTKAFIGDKRSDEVEIWAHHTLMDIYNHGRNTVGLAQYYRSMHQFGGYLSDKQVSTSGYTSRLDSRGGEKAIMVPPNKLLYSKEKDIAIAGIHLRLLHIPGETDDQIAVFWPDKNILLCGDDFYMAFPNLYAIRGTLFRSLKKWYQSLDILRALHASVLISSHTLPVYGKENIFTTLTDYRDAVQLVHDQTVRYINQGWHPDEIAEKVQLPKQLKNKPYLSELYGTVSWSSKGLFSGYMGWFSGDIVELNPHVPDEQAKRLVTLAGGIENLLSNAKQSLENNDPQWALRLSSAALRYDSSNQVATEVRIKSLLDLAALQTSMNGYNYYVTCAYTTMGTIKVKLPEGLKKQNIRQAKMADLFHMLSLRFKSEECSEIDQVVLFIFPDTKQNIKFHVRNGVIDFSGIYERDVDIRVKVDAVVWRDLLSGVKSGLLSAITSELTVEPSLSALREIMACFEKP